MAPPTEPSGPIPRSRPSGPPGATQPLEIKKSDPTRLEIRWADGERSLFSAKALRDFCPCAWCVDEHSGIRRHDPATTPAEIQTRAVSLVGHYALAIGFSDGHDTGIYPYRLLRERHRPG